MKTLLKYFLFLSVISNPLCSFAQAPFHRGVNLTNWFQANSDKEIQFTRFTKTDFQHIKSLGCDVIRLPINLHAMTGGAPDYEITPLFFQFLDSAVTWAEGQKIYLILDNHSFDPAVNTDPAVGVILGKVWKQVASRYSNRSAYIVYEILNEPHGLDDDVWNQIQGNIIGVIRSVDTRHSIVVGPANWNSYNNLNNMPVYKDNNLIYTFHFYDPFVFTHQGANWTSPSMETLKGVPFPYDASRMPSCPPDLAGTWINDALNSYANDGNIQYVKNLIDIAVHFKNQRQVPVYCGEFGVYMANSENPDRVYWYETVRKYFEQNNIPWTIWDYTGGFGLFNKGSSELFDYDINVPLVQALGFNVPEQKEFKIVPDSTGFGLYDDFVGRGMISSAWAGSGTIDFYSDQRPMQGSYCIDWNGGEQYTNISFDFRPDRDLSKLVSNGMVLDFWVRGNSPGTTFDARFVDSKTDSADHPWRMGITIDPSRVSWDGLWHLVRLPLSELTEKGSWDQNTWYNPTGKFDWSAVDLFEIVAETQPMTGRQIWLDNIRIADPVITGTGLENEDPFHLTLFPNPTPGTVTFDYYLAVPSVVEIDITDIHGREISRFSTAVQEAGRHRFTADPDADGSPAPPGIYIYHFKCRNFDQQGKFIMIR